MWNALEQVLAHEAGTVAALVLVFLMGLWSVTTGRLVPGRRVDWIVQSYETRIEQIRQDYTTSIERERGISNSWKEAYFLLREAELENIKTLEQAVSAVNENKRIIKGLHDALVAEQEGGSH